MPFCASLVDGHERDVPDTGALDALAVDADYGVVAWAPIDEVVLNVVYVPGGSTVHYKRESSLAAQPTEAVGYDVARGSCNCREAGAIDLPDGLRRDAVLGLHPSRSCVAPAAGCR